MKSSTLSKAFGFFFLPLFFLLSIHVASAQEQVESAVQEHASDNASSESLVAALNEDLERLNAIAEIITPAPASDFVSIALTAARSEEGQTLEGFTACICRAYPEYDCGYDFGVKELAQAYNVARHAVEQQALLLD